MVAGQPLPFSISLPTGNLYHARFISARLKVAVEGLHTAYGRFTGMSRDQMKQVFGDALRWQLQRIEQDQAGSLADPGNHATINSLQAEAREFLARGGVAARWTLEDHQRLKSSAGPDHRGHHLRPAIWRRRFWRTSRGLWQGVGRRHHDGERWSHPATDLQG